MLDRSSPIPLFHQIAEHYRYAIATGKIRPGDRLPSVRDAAGQWSVNLHTVRRAYGALAEEGLAESRGPQGTVARSAAPLPPARSRLDAFLDEVLDRGRRDHRLDPDTLVRRLASRVTAGGSAPTVTVLECSATQADGHAREITSRYRVEAHGRSLASRRAFPSGPLVATYFHYNDIRRQWPARLGEIRFAAIRPDPKIAEQVARPRRGSRATLLLCETDPGKASSIAADLSLILTGSDYRIEPRVVREPDELLRAARERRPILFSPRVWDRLSERQKADPRAIEVRYLFPADELQALASHFQWQPRI